MASTSVAPLSTADDLARHIAAYDAEIVGAVPFTEADDDAFDQLVTEIAQTEGVSFREARSLALAMTDELTVFALKWDLEAAALSQGAA